METYRQRLTIACVMASAILASCERAPWEVRTVQRVDLDMEAVRRLGAEAVKKTTGTTPRRCAARRTSR